MDHRGRRASARRLFVVYAAATLLPIALLAAVLLTITSRHSASRSLAAGRQEAVLEASTAIQPLLSGARLTSALPAEERAALADTVRGAIRDGQVLRLRVRNLSGDVLFSSDGSGADPRDPDALAAAAGSTSVRKTRLNGDAAGGGPQVVEVYTPLRAVGTDSRIGVLEIYLPYAPISTAEQQDRRQLMMTVLAGSGALWLVLLGVSRSVAGRLRRQTALAEHLARHDSVTGLPNRLAFLEARGGALAVIDVHGMQEVNDTLGYAGGEALLVAVRDRLIQTLPARTLLARLDEHAFGALLPASLTGVADIKQCLHAVRRACAAPLDIQGLPLAVQVSVGWTTAAPTGGPMDALLSQAHQAAAAAAMTRLRVLRWLPALDRRDPDALRLLGELRPAIATGQLVLHLQPKGTADSGRIVGVEALVRWQHPTRGLLLPGAFLAAAERTELIDELTWWVLTEAGRCLAALPTDLYIAVNISASTLIRDDFADEVLDNLRRSGTDPSRVLLEITETALLVDPDKAAVTLGRLTAAGIRISIDDFGAGQTSLAHLAALPIAELKIDRSFILALNNGSDNMTIVSSVVQLGHALGLTVTAEGVETERDLRTLERLGCDLIQGFHLARPQPLEAVSQLLGSRV